MPPTFDEVIKESIFVLEDTIDAQSGNPVIVDSFLILEHESVRNEQLFHVYDRYTGKYVQSFFSFDSLGYGKVGISEKRLKQPLLIYRFT